MYVTGRYGLMSKGDRMSVHLKREIEKLKKDLLRPVRAGRGADATGDPRRYWTRDAATAAEVDRRDDEIDRREIEGRGRLPQDPGPAPARGGRSAPDRRGAEDQTATWNGSATWR